VKVPRPGTVITIESYKHDGTRHRTWDKTLVLHNGRRLIGGNDRVLVTEADGRQWITREPAICTFTRGDWFNTIAMLREDGVYYYCNLGSPFRWKNGVLTYIDYDLDVKVYPDFTYVVLDEDEFEENRRRMGYPDAVVRHVYQGLRRLKQLIHHRKGPFQPGYVEKWFARYLAHLSGVDRDSLPRT